MLSFHVYQVPEYAEDGDHSVETTARTKNVVKETTSRTSLQSKSLPAVSINPSASSQNHHVTTLKTTTTSDKVLQLKKQGETSTNDEYTIPHAVDNSHITNQPLQIHSSRDQSSENFSVNHQSPVRDAVSENIENFTTPNTRSSMASDVFTYYNPVITNTLGNEKLTSPLSCASDIHDDLQRASVFIGRNQTTSPHRRSKQGRYMIVI
jgi:hypothetical protein